VRAARAPEEARAAEPPLKQAGAPPAESDPAEAVVALAIADALDDFLRTAPRR
jgi:hypothetical protein